LPFLYITPFDTTLYRRYLGYYTNYSLTNQVKKRKYNLKTKPICLHSNTHNSKQNAVLPAEAKHSR